MINEHDTTTEPVQVQPLPSDQGQGTPSPNNPITYPLPIDLGPMAKVDLPEIERPYLLKKVPPPPFSDEASQYYWDTINRFITTCDSWIHLVEFIFYFEHHLSDLSRKPPLPIGSFANHFVRLSIEHLIKRLNTMPSAELIKILPQLDPILPVVARNPKKFLMSWMQAVRDSENPKNYQRTMMSVLDLSVAWSTGATNEQVLQQNLVLTYAYYCKDISQNTGFLFQVLNNNHSLFLPIIPQIDALFERAWSSEERKTRKQYTELLMNEAHLNGDEWDYNDLAIYMAKKNDSRFKENVRKTFPADVYLPKRGKKIIFSKQHVLRYLDLQNNSFHNPPIAPRHDSTFPKAGKKIPIPNEPPTPQAATADSVTDPPGNADSVTTPTPPSP